MICSKCHTHIARNIYVCPNCSECINGGVVFVTGISGTGVRELLTKVIDIAHEHGHDVQRHDIGKLMRKHAEIEHLDVNWEKILDTDGKALTLLRAIAMNEVTNECNKNLNKLHVIDLHLTFRWKAYLTKGFNPHILEPFRSYARLFINVVEDLTKVQNKLLESSWGDRHIIELLYWRDEEKYLTDIFADICGLERAYVMGCSEPPAEMEKLIWHPDIKKVYLSFPITNIIKDKEAKKEITDFKDEIREFLMLFDPHSVKDYDDTYVFEEMREIRKEVGHTTEERDYRLIDQADAVVVYFPKHVGSKGVDAEMNYARQTGKPIYKYTPGKKEEGPFAVPPSHFSDNPKEFVKLLKEKLS